ncbi:STM3941 family protein [Jiella avicenniae]|uniref:STM3941 family protein n=1 Tax=Jiella avicenniae TaxID=2907202 RepID=UPI003B848224
MSLTRLRLFAVGCFLASLGSLALVLTWDEPPSEDFKYWMIWLGVPFFGFGACVLFSRMTWSGPVVVLSPEGLRDRRMSPAIIPWTAIRSLKPRSYRGAKLLVLEIDRDLERRVPWSLTFRMNRWPNAILGAKGPWIVCSDLQITHERMVEVVEAYWHTFGPMRQDNG